MIGWYLLVVSSKVSKIYLALDLAGFSNISSVWSTHRKHSVKQKPFDKLVTRKSHLVLGSWSFTTR